MRFSRDLCPATSVSKLYNRFLIEDMQMLTARANLRNGQTGGCDLGGFCGERKDKQFRWECRRVSAYHSCHLASGDGCMNKSHASIPPSPEQEYDQYMRDLHKTSLYVLDVARRMMMRKVADIG